MAAGQQKKDEEEKPKEEKKVIYQCLTSFFYEINISLHNMKNNSWRFIYRNCRSCYLIIFFFSFLLYFSLTLHYFPNLCSLLISTHFASVHTKQLPTSLFTPSLLPLPFSLDLYPKLNREAWRTRSCRLTPYLKPTETLRQSVTTTPPAS